MDRGSWRLWGGADAALGEDLRLVPPFPASVGNSLDGADRAPALFAQGLPVVLPLRIPLVLRQLLLGSRHHDALRRYAPRGARRGFCRIQPGSGPLFWTFRVERDACAPRHRQHASRAIGCTDPVDCAGTCRCADHECSMGPTWLLAGG